MKVPVVIVTGQADVTVPPATHARVADALIPEVGLQTVPRATHYSFLGQCTAAGRKGVSVHGEAVTQVEVHRTAIEAASRPFQVAFAGHGD